MSPGACGFGDTRKGKKVTCRLPAVLRVIPSAPRARRLFPALLGVTHTPWGWCPARCTPVDLIIRRHYDPSGRGRGVNSTCSLDFCTSSQYDDAVTRLYDAADGNMHSLYHISWAKPAEQDWNVRDNL